MRPIGAISAERPAWSPFGILTVSTNAELADAKRDCLTMTKPKGYMACRSYRKRRCKCSPIGELFACGLIGCDFFDHIGTEIAFAVGLFPNEFKHPEEMHRP